MAPAALAATEAEGDTAVDETLFRGIRFWIAQRVPSRAFFIDKVRQNGGQIVPLEKLADILIADHFRNDCPPNSFSYTWIERSIADGILQEKENHRAGPAADYVRPVGALNPAKTGRNSYTAEDDRVLYEWVTDRERKGGRILGNEIYKQLEQQNPRHPWQSWRDRWVKYVSRKAPPTSATLVAIPAPEPRAQFHEPIEALDEEVTIAAVPKPESLREEEQSPNHVDTGLIQNNEGDGETYAVKEHFVPNHTEVPTIHANVGLSKSHHAYSTTASSGNHSVLENSNATTSDIDHIGTEQVASPITDVASAEGASRPTRRAKSRLYSIPRRARESILLEQRSEVPQPFTQDEIDMLYASRGDIETIPIGNYDAAWVALAESNPVHTAIEWKEYYENEVLPYVEEENEGTAESEAEIETEDDDGADEDVGNEETGLLNALADGDSLINDSSSIRPGIPPHAVAPILELHDLDNLSTSHAYLAPTIEQNKNATSTDDMQVDHHAAMDSPTKQTFRAVVVPSLSPDQRMEYTALHSNSKSQHEQESPTRKRAHASMEQDAPSTSNTRNSSKKRHLDSAYVERSQQASSALLNALNAPTVLSRHVDIEVISISDSDDEHEEQNIASRAVEVNMRQESIVKQDFDVYESHEVPEGEEENVILNESGSPSFPRHHMRVRSKDALVVFGDPPTDFKLMQQEPSSEDIWHDIVAIKTEQGNIANAPLVDLDNGDDYSERLEEEDSASGVEYHTLNSQQIDLENGEDRETLQVVEENGMSSPWEDRQGVESEAVPGYHVLHHPTDMTFEELGLQDSQLAARTGVALEPLDVYEQFDEEEHHNGEVGVGSLSVGKAIMQNTDQENEDVPDDIVSIASYTSDDGMLSRLAPPADELYDDHETNELFVQPDTPSNQLRAEMRETNLRYSSESDEYSDDEQQANNNALNYSQSVAQPYVDTQAIVEFETIADDYLDVPPPEEYEDDGAPTPRALHDSFIASRTRGQEMGRADQGHQPPAQLVDPDTQAILEADTQPFVLDEHPQTSVEESQISVDFARTANNDTLQLSIDTRHSRQAPPSTPPQQMYYSDDSTHVPSSPPIISTNTSTFERRAQGLRTNSAQPSGRGQSTVSSTYAGMDPAEAFKARQQALGSTEEDVTYALFRTNFDSRVAAQVLESMRHGNDLPKELRGVWTEEEDEILLGGDARAMRMVERRHGSAASGARLQTLEQFVAASDDEDG